MKDVDRLVDRALALLQQKIRGRGFTQLEIQETLGWGRSYISQLVTKQKGLRVEQVLMILQVIGIQPSEFFYELFHGERGRPGASRYGSTPIDAEQVDEMQQGLATTGALLRSVVDLLLDRGLITPDELTAARDAATHD
ncbi:MAG: helix-turn-helix transcriptional regulator [bacterium]|nr:helix-turn-helix transcriptional regulator [bacterium]